MSAAVRFRDVTVHFADGDVTAVRDVSLDVAVGEFVALLGPSGCGKSTLLRVAAGQLGPTSGTVATGPPDAPDRCDGAAHATPASGRRRALAPPAVAWMPQADSLLPWWRALDNAALGARIAGLGRREARDLAAGMFGPFGLAGFERAWPWQLSGGMRQRLALLRTVLTGAPVLLLDEPFGALDPLLRRELNRWLARTLGPGVVHTERDAPAVPVTVTAAATRTGRAALAAESRTVLLVTHDIDEALLLADRVVVLSGRPGTLVAEFALRRPGPGLPPDDAPELRAAVLAALDRTGRQPPGPRPPTSPVQASPQRRTPVRAGPYPR